MTPEEILIAFTSGDYETGEGARECLKKLIAQAQCEAVEKTLNRVIDILMSNNVIDYRYGSYIREGSLEKLKRLTPEKILGWDERGEV